MINARNVGTLLDELLTDPTVKKDSWSTVDEALRKAECIRKEEGEAFLPMKVTIYEGERVRGGPSTETTFKKWKKGDWHE